MRCVLKRNGASTNIPWQVSGRRYASSPRGPIPTLNIMLNRLVPVSGLLQLLQTILFSARRASNSASWSPSGTGCLVFSSMSLSVLYMAWQLEHSTIGSLKLATCPEATKTALGRIWAVSISTISSALTSLRLQRPTYLFLKRTPSGP